MWAIYDDVGDDAHIVPKNYDKYRKTVGATLRGRPIFSPHPSFAFGKTHLPLKGKACRGGNLPPARKQKEHALIGAPFSKNKRSFVSQTYVSCVSLLYFITLNITTSNKKSVQQKSCTPKNTSSFAATQIIFLNLLVCLKSLHFYQKKKQAI